jgi:hypothetical protein
VLVFSRRKRQLEIAWPVTRLVDNQSMGTHRQIWQNQTALSVGCSVIRPVYGNLTAGRPLNFDRANRHSLAHGRERCLACTALPHGPTLYSTQPGTP